MYAVVYLPVLGITDPNTTTNRERIPFLWVTEKKERKQKSEGHNNTQVPLNVTKTKIADQSN